MGRVCKLRIYGPGRSQARYSGMQPGARQGGHTVGRGWEENYFGELLVVHHSVGCDMCILPTAGGEYSQPNISVHL
jgi:hypothetical protein